ncbi:hypothetical protein [Mycobacteroides abscessus]|nr:hypothetical protein [Mycobacteroides abscessus]
MLQEKARQQISAGVSTLFLFLLSEFPIHKADESDPWVLVSPAQARKNLDLLFDSEYGETIAHVALLELPGTHPRGTKGPGTFERLAQLVAPLIWEHHLRRGCKDKGLCPLATVARLASVRYIDTAQTPWLPTALEHLIATHPYRTSTFTLLEILARFPMPTAEIRAEVFTLLRTVEASMLPEILGSQRLSPWRRVISRLHELCDLSADEFHLMRRIGNRLIAAGDTGIIDAHLELIDRYEPMP